MRKKRCRVLAFLVLLIMFTTNISALPQSSAQIPTQPHSAIFYTLDEVILFSYADGTGLTVKNDVGALIWSGTLNKGQHRHLTPGEGIYSVDGSGPYTLLVGVAENDCSVVGYYTVDPSGSGTSMEFYTYLILPSSQRPSSTAYFIIIAYADDTLVTVTNADTGATLWIGTLDRCAHFEQSLGTGGSPNPTWADQFVHIVSSHPVSALITMDTGYHVPSSTGSFVGTLFCTCAGGVTSGLDDLNVIGYYDGTLVTIKNTGGATMCTGTINEGEVHSESFSVATYITVETNKDVAVSADPYTYYTEKYWAQTFAVDKSGKRIGTLFYTTARTYGYLYIYAHEDSTSVTVTDQVTGLPKWSGTLNNMGYHKITTSHTIYKVNSTKSVSVLEGYGYAGSNWGAEFAPVHTHPTMHHLDAEPPVLINLTDPVDTAWQELYPSYCNWHYLAGWFDSNNNSTLDRGDHVILDNETGYSGWYNVEDVTVTLRLTNSTLNETMYVEFSGSIQEFPFNDPVNTTWHEVYLEYGNLFDLTFWSDIDLTGNLTSSDQITLQSENATEWHVDSVKTDLLVTFEKYPDFGDAPDWIGDPVNYMFPSNLLSWLGYAFPPDTVSYWQFEEGKELTAKDHIHGNDGTLINGPIWMDSFWGHALSFDGIDDYANVPDVDDSLDVGTGDFSVQAWINASDVSGVTTIIDKRISQYSGYAVFIWNGRLGLQLADGTSYANYAVPADMSIAADGNWHFVFISVDRHNCATFYVDDKEISIPIGHSGSLANGAGLWIGGNHISGSSYYFEGGIDEVAIYKRALTPREARQLHLMQVRDGASHVDWNYEWLGQSVNGELDSKQVDRDEFDDGVEMALVPIGGPPMDHNVYLSLKITITTSGEPGRYDISDPDKKMYLNAWIDWNRDYDWADDGEKIVGTGSPNGTQAFAGPQTISYPISIPESALLGYNWLRVRLDYGEDVGKHPQSWTDVSLDQYKGQAMFGEVEDYLLFNDVAPSDVEPSKLVIGQGYSGKINVTVANQGGCTETFNVTAYANATAIQTITNVTLLSKDSATLTFTWNTSGFAKGNYTISAYASPVPYENDTEDNMVTNGTVYVGIPGDINADGKVDVKDVYKIALAYGTSLEGPNPPDRTYVANCDINGDDKVDVKDYYIVCRHYGEVSP